MVMSVSEFLALCKQYDTNELPGSNNNSTNGSGSDIPRNENEDEKAWRKRKNAIIEERLKNMGTAQDYARFFSATKDIPRFHEFFHAHPSTLDSDIDPELLIRLLDKRPDVFSSFLIYRSFCAKLREKPAALVQLLTKANVHAAQHTGDKQHGAELAKKIATYVYGLPIYDQLIKIAKVMHDKNSAKVNVDSGAVKSLVETLIKHLEKTDPLPDAITTEGLREIFLIDVEATMEMMTPFHLNIADRLIGDADAVFLSKFFEKTGALSSMAASEKSKTFIIAKTLTNNYEICKRILAQKKKIHKYFTHDLPQLIGGLDNSNKKVIEEALKDGLLPHIVKSRLDVQFTPEHLQLLLRLVPGTVIPVMDNMHFMERLLDGLTAKSSDKLITPILMMKLHLQESSSEYSTLETLISHWEIRVRIKNSILFFQDKIAQLISYRTEVPVLNQLNQAKDKLEVLLKNTRILERVSSPTEHSWISDKTLESFSELMSSISDIDASSINLFNSSLSLLKGLGQAMIERIKHLPSQSNGNNNNHNSNNNSHSNGSNNKSENSNHTTPSLSS